MKQDKIEYLTKIIKRNYERYLGERANRKASLLDIATSFNIPIDQTREQDYMIQNIDYNDPSIEIVDTKTNTSYTATYTYDANLLHYSSEEKDFNRVVSTSPIRQEERLYYIGNKTPIITKMTFTDGDYELVFEKEIGNSVNMFFKQGVKFSIKYLQNIMDHGKVVQQPLFTKIYKDSSKDKNENAFFEQLYTYGGTYSRKEEDTQDCYTYLRNNQVIHGINQFRQKGFCNYLQAICLGNTKGSIDSYFPFNMYADDYPLLREGQTLSAMLFQGGTSDGLHHSLEIYKGEEVIKIIYSCKDKDCPDATWNDEYCMPSIEDGNISSLELQYIISGLNSRIRNSFTEIITDVLTTFGTKIDIGKGKILEKLEPLPSRLFIDLSFEEICSFVQSNKEECFRAISEQFEETTNIEKADQKGKTKVLKPTDTD